MAGRLLAFSGIITKSKAMKSNLLTKAEFEQMINMSSVSDIIVFLKEHEGYRGIFENMEIIHRGQIEHELIHSLQMTYAKLYRFARVKQRNLIRMFFYRFEILVIRECLQGISRGEELFDLSLFEEFFRKHSEIDLAKISSADTIDSFIEALRGTNYYEILKEVQNVPNPELFDFETRLDVYYFEKMWKIKDKYLSGRERRAFTDIIGREIDLLNLIWIYRFKTYFDTDNGKIMKSIIPIQYKLTKRMVADMVAADGIPELNEMIKNCPYHRLFHEEDINKDELEHSYRSYIDRVYKEHAQANEMSIIPIYLFLHMKEREMDKLTTAIECVRYGLTPDRSLKILENL